MRHSISGYVTFPEIHRVVSLERASCYDFHQVNLAVRDVLSVSSIPINERIVGFDSAPFISCSGSEQLVGTRGSVSSRIAVASLGEAFKEIMPGVADLSLVDHSGILINAGPDVNREDLTDPYIDVASAEGVLEWCINDIIIPNSITLSDSLKVVSRLSKTFSFALHHFSLGSVNSVNFTGLLETCRVEFSRTDQVEAARLDALDFSLTPEVMEQDLPDLISEGSLENLVRKRQKAAYSDHLNIDRLNHSFGHLPGIDLERARLITLQGSQLLLPEGFKRQPSPSPMRQMAARLGNTYLKHGYKLWLKGKALLFNVNELPQDTFNKLNFGNNAHFTGKPNCPEGRFLFDPNHPEEGYSGLNTDEGLERMRSIYGGMTLPTIKEFLTLIYNVRSRKGCSLCQLRIWKEDVKGAFGQTNIDPSCAWLSAMSLSASIIIIFICGFFGYNGQPLVFNVFTRLIHQALSDKLDGGLFMYVDDLVGVSHINEADNDQLIAQNFLKGLFGDNALASDNTTPTQAVDVIGWRVDLEKDSIRPNDKGLRKLFFVLFAVIDNEAKYWPLVQVQVLSSLFERYSMAIIGMRAFIDPINRLLSHNPNSHPNILRKISASARFCVVMWRAISLIMLVNPDALSVPISSVVQSGSLSIDYRATSDAANSIGLVVFNHLDEMVLVTSYKFPFFAPSSSYQNAKEFMGLLLALILIKIKLNPLRGTKVALTGDNTSSLTWIEKNKANSPSAHIAFLAYSWVVITTGLRVESVTHIAGASDQMKNIDALSRNYSNELDSSPHFIATTGNLKLDSLFKLCDPTIVRGPMPDQLLEFEIVVACVLDLFSSY